jgi:hypothetical protein
MFYELYPLLLHNLVPVYSRISSNCPEDCLFLARTKVAFEAETGGRICPKRGVEAAILGHLRSVMLAGPR